MDISQIPVTTDKRIVGSINESHLFNKVTKNPEVLHQPVETIMQPAFPFADISTPLDSLSGMITNENPAVLVKDFKTDQTYIITRFDIINALA
jgi:cystathionine beta-synthase